ncbi:MAG: hypothetical protein Q7T50_01470 [Candidatus Magasanikbacteria bacterium]|nr:hypothetical protein [Candidatus Magasanikbacteria bacterium]
MSNKKRDLKEKSVLKMLKGREMKQVSISMPIELIERFDAKKKDLENNGYTLVMSEICCEAVEQALHKADREIAEILNKKTAEKN